MYMCAMCFRTTNTTAVHCQPGLNAGEDTIYRERWRERFMYMYIIWCIIYLSIYHIIYIYIYAIVYLGSLGYTKSNKPLANKLNRTNSNQIKQIQLNNMECNFFVGQLLQHLLITSLLTCCNYRGRAPAPTNWKSRTPLIHSLPIAPQAETVWVVP